MTFADFWRLVTTSRYTRKLERENAELRDQIKELKRENQALIFAIGRKPTELPDDVRAAAESSADENFYRPEQRVQPRPKKRPGFTQIKRQLEVFKD